VGVKDTGALIGKMEWEERRSVWFNRLNGSHEQKLKIIFFVWRGGVCCLRMAMRGKMEEKREVSGEKKVFFFFFFFLFFH
jgi:hypothetical protein